VSRQRRPARVHRNPSPRERAVSLGILALLPLIAGAVFVKGRQVDPSVFSAAAAVPGSAPIRTPGALSRVPPLDRNPETPRAARAESASTSSLPDRFAGLPWQPDGPVEEFTPDTLYQKIDGRADEYLNDGFVRLRFASYAQGTQFIDVFVYDMGTENHARHRWSAERPPGALPSSVGSAAYTVASSAFFVQGQQYVQVIGSEPGDDIEAAVRTIAGAIADALNRPGWSSR
jgi:hypothetical protein